MALNRKDDAVSPVIGVILMVAITVILAAVIAAFVFGMSGNIQRTKLVGVNVERPNATVVSMTFHGGADAATLMKVCWTVNGQNRGLQFNTADPTKPIPLGSSNVIPAVFPHKDHVIGIGYFTDGSSQVIFDSVL
jgi:archaeal type IV pilus assembly protein PilA